MVTINYPGTMRRVVFGVAVLVHLVALYLPGSPEPAMIDIPGLDKAVHVVLFAVPAYLLRRMTPAWWPIVVFVAHAPISEVVQGWVVPDRSGDPLDAVADLMGVTLGVWLAGRIAAGERDHDQS